MLVFITEYFNCNQEKRRTDTDTPNYRILHAQVKTKTVMKCLLQKGENKLLVKEIQRSHEATFLHLSNAATCATNK